MTSIYKFNFFWKGKSIYSQLPYKSIGFKRQLKTVKGHVISLSGYTMFCDLLTVLFFASALVFLDI